MKKIVLSVIAVLAISATGVAQDRTFKLGVKGGVNLSDMDTNTSKTIESVKNENLTGFHVGVVAEIFLSDKFSIQPEVMYSAQGNSLKVVIDEQKHDFKNKIDYLTVPVMLKYYVIGGLNINAGPQIGFNIKSESDGVDVKTDTNKVDLGLNFGVGYETSLGLFFDARYNVGLTDVTKDSFKSREGVEGIGFSKNKVIQLSVGFKF